MVPYNVFTLDTHILTQKEHLCLKLNITNNNQLMINYSTTPPSSFSTPLLNSTSKSLPDSDTAV